MDRADVVAAAFRPPPFPLPVPLPTVDASPPRRFRDAIEPIAMHSVWCEQTGDALAELGLDFLSAYVGARAGLLGDPDPGVVVSSFAVFAPAMVTGLFEQARATCGRAELLDTRDTATITSLTDAIGDVESDRIDETADILQQAVISADGTARPLFSGLLSRPWPESPVGRIWRACELAREHRGDSHNAVCITAGLGPIQMNILTEVWLGMPLGSYSATRGWTDEQIAETAEDLRTAGILDGDEISDEGRVFRDDIEAATDQLEVSIVDTLADDFSSVVGRLEIWSQRCIDAGAFPPDPYKRAAG